MLVPKITFVFDRRKSADKKHKGSIELRITLGKKQKFMSTGIMVYPHQWKGGNPYVSGYETSGEDNIMLASIYKRCSHIVADMVEHDRIDIDSIPTLLKQKSVDMTFIDYIYKRMDAKKVGELTHRQYVSFFNRLSEYGKIKFFTDITEKGIRDWDEWLHGYSWKEKDRYGKEVVMRYSESTIGAYHKNMKAFIADAVIDGFLSENIYVSKRIKVNKGDPRIDKFLTPDELEQIKKAEMPTSSLSVARDVFVFQCLTGLSYVDLMDFDADKVTPCGEIGIYHGVRHKTGTAFTTIVTDEAKEVLNRLGGYIPHIPNQKYNIKLKLVADAAGVDKEISSHYARHTAASVWLNQGVPVAIIARVLGHTNTAVTEKVYSKMLDDTIVEAFSKKKKDGE